MQVTKKKGALYKGTDVDLARVENSCKLHQLFDVCSLANQRFSENCLLLSQPFWVSDCLGHTHILYIHVE